MKGIIGTGILWPDALVANQCAKNIHWNSSFFQPPKWRRRTAHNAACLEISFLVDENVFWLQIAIDDFQRVKILESEDDLSGVERCLGLATATTVSHQNIRKLREKRINSRFNWIRNQVSRSSGLGHRVNDFRPGRVWSEVECVVWNLCCYKLGTFWPLNKFTSYSCDGLPSCQFWASYRPFCSRVKSRHAIDRRTDRRTYGRTVTCPHFIIPLPYGDGV